MCLLAVYIAYLEKMSILVLFPFLNWVVCGFVELQKFFVYSGY